MRRISTILTAVVLTAAALLTASPAQAASDRTPPTAPANLRAATVSFTWASLTWDASADNSGALYYEATISGPDGQYSQTSLDPTTGFGGLRAGQAYTVSVRALDYAGNASAAVTAGFTTLPRTGPPPTTPANLRGVYTDGVLTAIAWDPSVFDGGLSYDLYSGSTLLWSDTATSVTIRDLVYIACAVVPGGTYPVTVRAWGTNNYPSEVSAPLTVTIPTTVPAH